MFGEITMAKNSGQPDWDERGPNPDERRRPSILVGKGHLSIIWILLFAVSGVRSLGNGLVGTSSVGAGSVCLP
jgi:hypothetical protein